jgi:hypothetical protein
LHKAEKTKTLEKVVRPELHVVGERVGCQVTFGRRTHRYSNVVRARLRVMRARSQKQTQYGQAFAASSAAAAATAACRSILCS